jgi:hypothetical protein
MLQFSQTEKKKNTIRIHFLRLIHNNLSLYEVLTFPTPSPPPHFTGIFHPFVLPTVLFHETNDSKQNSMCFLLGKNKIVGNFDKTKYRNHNITRFLYNVQYSICFL